MPLNKDGSVHHVAPEDGSAIDEIWTCRLSGRTDMSFADALDSEANLQKILQLDFAAEWEKASLQRIHHSRLDISRLAERCVQTLEDSRIELGETVYYEPKKGKSYHCKVIQVLENTPKKNEKENSVVRYDLVRIEDNVEVAAVPRSKLSRLIPIPGIELMKIFIRAHSHRYKYEPEMPWVVDEPYLSMHKIEAKLDMDQVWMAQKEGKLILPPAPTENKKRKRSEASIEPKAKKTKTDKKETKSIPVKTTKKKKKQPTLFDHFQTGVTSKPKNGDNTPEYAPKLLDLVDLAKSLEAERNSSDDYWETAGKIATTTCMWSATMRDELFEKTSCAQTLKDDIFGRIQIKKLTQSSRGMKFRLKGMRPLPNLSPIQTVFDEEFTNLINSTDLNPSLILILCDFVLQFDLSDIRDRLHGLSEDKMTGYHYHKYVSKFVVDLLNGEEDASNLFWTELFLEHIYKKPSDNLQKPRKKSYNGFQLGSHVITKLPQPCLPYLAGWNDCHTPRERSDLIFEVIESCLDYTGMEEMFADWRTTPLGSDRNGHLYWMFYFSSFVFIEDISSQSWSCLTNMEDFCRLVSRLDERHVAEYSLKKEFQEQREEIQAQFENFESLSTQASLAPPRRTTRRQAENSELPKMSIKESLVHEVKLITDKLWMGQLADIEDGDVLQSRIDSLANGSLESLKEIMIQIINSVPNSNLNDHLWNGKEKFVYLEKFNGAQDVAEFCIFWAMFDRKIKWEKFEKRKIEVLPSRASTRRRATVKYTYDDTSQDSRYDDDENVSSEDEQLIDDEELMKKLSRLPTRTSARLRNHT